MARAVSSDQALDHGVRGGQGRGVTRRDGLAQARWGAQRSATNRAMVFLSMPRWCNKSWFRKTWSLLWRRIQGWSRG